MSQSLCAKTVWLITNMHIHLQAVLLLMSVLIVKNKCCSQSVIHLTYALLSVVRTKAVQAKIDQLQKKVIITSTTHRTFGRQHWQLLHQNLVRWQQNLANVQTNLRALEIMQAQQAQSVQQWNWQASRRHWLANFVKHFCDSDLERKGIWSVCKQTVNYFTLFKSG